MLQILIQAINRWIDQHGGRQPICIRVPPFVMRQLERDLDELPTKHDPAAIGGFKLAGISIVEDPRVFVAEVNGGS